MWRRSFGLSGCVIATTEARPARPSRGSERSTRVRDAAIARIKQEIAEEKQRVKDAGGLFVLGTERHESRRIDNQLRPGRFGIASQLRQTDDGARPGTIVMPSGDRVELSGDDHLIGRLADCAIVVSDGNTSRETNEVRSR